MFVDRFFIGHGKNHTSKLTVSKGEKLRSTVKLFSQVIDVSATVMKRLLISKKDFKSSLSGGIQSVKKR